MALNIKSEEADKLARKLAESTGESLTSAVETALRERLERLEGQKRSRGLREEIARMQARIAELPLLDRRSADEILGYDDYGLPG